MGAIEQGIGFINILLYDQAHFKVGYVHVRGGNLFPAEIDVLIEAAVAGQQIGGQVILEFIFILGVVFDQSGRQHLVGKP